MKGIISAIVLFAALSQAAPCPDGKDNKSPASKPDRDVCGGSVNCEMYFNERTGRWQGRFKKDMGPGSEWYEKHVTPLDPWGNSTKASLVTRQTGTPTTDIHRSTERTMFGTWLPRDAYNNLYNHCWDTGCDAGSFEMHTETADPGGVEIQQGELVYNVDSDFPSGSRNYFIQAIADMADKGVKSEPRHVLVGDLGYQPSPKTITVYTGASGFEIYRSIGQFTTGHITVDITFVPDNPDTCGIVTGLLAGLLGPLGEFGAIGAGFFGAAGAVGCFSSS